MFLLKSVVDWNERLICDEFSEIVYTISIEISFCLAMENKNYINKNYEPEKTIFAVCRFS